VENIPFDLSKKQLILTNKIQTVSLRKKRFLTGSQTTGLKENHRF
jgi:hypothetical protein